MGAWMDGMRAKINFLWGARTRWSGKRSENYQRATHFETCNKKGKTKEMSG